MGAVLAPSAGYMTKYECATFDGLVAGNNLTVADDEPDKVQGYFAHKKQPPSRILQ